MGRLLLTRLRPAGLLTAVLLAAATGLQAQDDADANLHVGQRRALVVRELQAWLEAHPTDSVVYRRLYGLLQMQILEAVVDQDAGGQEVQGQEVQGQEERAAALASLEAQVRTLAEAWAKNAPNEPDALLALAACQNSAQQREQIVTTAARRFPDNLYAHQMLAYTLGRQSRRSGAAVLDRYLVQHPDSREAFVALLVYCQGIEDHDRVRVAVNRWLGHQPDDALALRTRLELFAAELTPAEITHDLALLLDNQQIDGQTHLELCAVALRRNLFELGKSCSARALERADVQAEQTLSSKARRYLVWSSVLLGDWTAVTRELTAIGSAEPAMRLSMARSLLRLERCSDANRLLAPLDALPLDKQQQEQLLEIRSGCGDLQAGHELWRRRLEAAGAEELAASLRQIREHVSSRELFTIMLDKLQRAADRQPLLDALVPFLIGRSREQMMDQRPLLEAWASFFQPRSEQGELVSPWLLEQMVGAVYGDSQLSGARDRPVKALVKELLAPTGVGYQLDEAVGDRRCTVALAGAAWPQYLEAVCATVGCTWQVGGSGTPVIEITGRDLTQTTVSIEVTGAPAAQVLRQLAEAAGLAVTIDPTLTGQVTLLLDSIEWPTALDLVCRQLGCRWQRSTEHPQLLSITRASAG